MRRSLLVFALAALAVAGRAGRAQDVTVTPDPVPLDGALTIHVSGVMPGGFLGLYWDRARTAFTSPNVYLTTNATADANGDVNFTLDQLPFRVYPATVGSHTLTVTYFPALGSGAPVDPNTFEATVPVPVTIAPRANWPAAAPVAPQAPPGFSGGLLAFLNSSADHATTSIALSDGATTKTWVTAPAGSVVVQPAWSPDGSQLAVSATIDTSPDSNVFVIDRTGKGAQVTTNGGAPPRLTGGGAGSVVGSFVPALHLPVYHVADFQQENCGDLAPMASADGTMLIAPERFPMVVYVYVVGTGKGTVVALPPGGKDGDPFPFRFDGLPEGDYSIHASATMAYCREYTKINPATVSNPNAPATLVVHDRTLAVVNSTLTIHVAAGQVAQFQEAPLVDLYYAAGSPTWLDGETVIYNQQTATSVGATFSGLVSVPLGGTPVQLTDSLKPMQGPFATPVVSPVTKRLVTVPVAFGGIIIADAADIPGTRQTLINDLEIQKTLQQTTFSPIFDNSPAWSPDGSSYVAFIRSGLQGLGNGQGDLWIKNVSTGVEYQLSQFTANGEGVFGRPAWSPDGSQIAVGYSPDNVKTTNIRIYNVADGSSFDLTNDGRSASPAWTGFAKAADFPAGAAFLPQTGAGGAGGGALPGDLNGDGKVTVQDATIALQIVVGSVVPTAAQKKAADLNGDGMVDIRDVTLILKKAVGL